MATVYFTSNADSGSGTLRAALSSAEAGDVIMPDPNVFTSGPVVISCSSSLVTQLDVTIDGGTLGIVLDGQGSNISAISLATAGETTLINCTIKRFKRTTAAPVYLNHASVILNLHRCIIADNSNRYYGAVYILKGAINLYDSLITGNDITTNSSYAALYLASNGYATATRSTISGNVRANVSGTSRLTNTNSFVGLTAPEIDGVTPEEIGFVTPPPSASITFGEYTDGDWEAWDFRLKPTSAYLTGASYQSGDKDLLGHDRTGSWGCYDGSWLVVPDNGTGSISADLTVDYADIGDSAAVTLSDGVKVAVTKEATIRAATLTSSARAYFAIAPSSSISNSVSTTNVVVCYYGAGVTSVTVVGNTIQWTAVSVITPVLIELEDNGSYTTVTTTASGGSYSYNGASEGGTTLRLFDGVSFFSVTITEAASYYEVAELYSVGYVIQSEVSPSYIVLGAPSLGYIQ